MGYASDETEAMSRHWQDAWLLRGGSALPPGSACTSASRQDDDCSGDCGSLVGCGRINYWATDTGARYARIDSEVRSEQSHR